MIIQKLLGRSDIYFSGDLYMRRWRIFDNRWFGVRVHHIVRSDRDRELHDHPFSFASFILSGGYWEHTVDRRKVWYGPMSLVCRSAEALHRLELEDQPAWTLVFRGPRRRNWGFLTGAGRWVAHEVFLKLRPDKTESES